MNMIKSFASTLIFALSFTSPLLIALEHTVEPLDNEQVSLEQDQNFNESKPVESGSAEEVSQEQSPVGLSIDRYLSPDVGSDVMLSILRVYQKLDDRFIPSTMGDTEPKMIAARLGKYILEGFIIGTEMVAQHEIFGHGFRLREFKVPVTRYEILPWKGSTHFRAAKYIPLSLHQKIAVDVGGMEANSILARQIQTRWLQSGVMDTREAHLFRRATLDQTTYVLGVKTDHTRFPNGNDVGSYINNVNAWYQKPVLSTRKLKNRILIDFLDPYFFYSLYSFGSYIIEGNQYWEFPLIPPIK